jgi:thiol-disulfide isomerase/thioredoxin
MTQTVARLRPVTAALAALAWLLIPRAHAEEPWLLEFDEAQTAAQRDGKDLLIDFSGSDWCAPCKWLKDKILTRTEFIERASKHFVLLDIDDLARKPMPEGRKERYQKLQQRFGIETFPSMVLATPEGLPYAETTYLQSITDPVAYWKHLEPLQQRGQRLREALARAKKLEGREVAEAFVGGLVEVHAGFVPQFYGEYVRELRQRDPGDETGYLTFLDGRRALAALQQQVKDKGVGATDAEAVDALIEKHKLQGETLQDALILRALVQVGADQPLAALDSFEAMLAAHKTRTRFDRGDFVPLDAASMATVARRVALGKKDPKDALAQYHALHCVFESELPDRFEISCGHGYRPQFMARGIIGDRYGQLLIDATANLTGEERAKALGQGLEGTRFYRQNAIRKIIEQLLPELAGRDGARKYLPAYYRGWVGS